MKARASFAAAALLCLGISGSGCYGGKTFQAVQRLEVQMAELDSLSRVQRADLGALREDFGKQNEFLRSTKADTDVRLTEQARRLDVSVGKLEDLNVRFSEVLQHMDASRMPATPDAGSPDTSQASAGAAGGMRPNGDSNTAPSPSGTGGVRDAKPLYDAAYGDFLNGRYDMAREGFQQFVGNYGQSELAGNAQFWIGETYYQEKKFSEAIAAYQKVVDKYPNNIKVPAAMLKLAQSEAAFGSRAAARKTLQQLMHDFPGTDEAKQAAKRVKTL